MSLRNRSHEHCERVLQSGIDMKDGVILYTTGVTQG